METSEAWDTRATKNLERPLVGSIGFAFPTAVQTANVEYLMPHYATKTGALSELDSMAAKTSRLYCPMWRVLPERSKLTKMLGVDPMFYDMAGHPDHSKPSLDSGVLLIAYDHRFRKHCS